jgi:hypothetical protein
VSTSNPTLLNSYLLFHLLNSFHLFHSHFHSHPLPLPSSPFIYSLLLQFIPLSSSPYHLPPSLYLFIPRILLITHISYYSSFSPLFTHISYYSSFSPPSSLIPFISPSLPFLPFSPFSYFSSRFPLLSSLSIYPSNLKHPSLNQINSFFYHPSINPPSTTLILSLIYLYTYTLVLLILTLSSPLYTLLIILLSTYSSHPS